MGSRSWDHLVKKIKLNQTYKLLFYTECLYLVNLLIVIIWLMQLVWVWPKVIPLSSICCTLKPLRCRPDLDWLESRTRYRRSRTIRPGNPFFRWASSRWSSWHKIRWKEGSGEVDPGPDSFWRTKKHRRNLRMKALKVLS
jgi:hypothetical protein